MKTSAVFAAILAVVAATPIAGKGEHGGHEGWKGKACPAPKEIYDFDAIYKVVATPEQVVNASNIATGGLKGALGYYNYGINSRLDTICYNITLVGVTGAYQSLARTATHIHEAAKGLNGPPRIAIPNPTITETEATLDQRLDEMTLNEILLRHDILQEPPRHALALQMADLDRRREAFKKHRSNRGFVNFLDEQRTFLQRQSHRMQSVIRSMMQNPSFQHEFVTALHGCAKAA